MNISLLSNSVNTIVTSFKEQITSSLSAQQKTVMVIAIAIFAGLTMLYFAYRCCFRANQVKDKVSSNNQDPQEQVKFSPIKHAQTLPESPNPIVSSVTTPTSPTTTTPANPAINLPLAVVDPALAKTATSPIEPIKLPLPRVLDFQTEWMPQIITFKFSITASYTIKKPNTYGIPPGAATCLSYVTNKFSLGIPVIKDEQGNYYFISPRSETTGDFDEVYLSLPPGFTTIPGSFKRVKIQQLGSNTNEPYWLKEIEVVEAKSADLNIILIAVGKPQNRFTPLLEAAQCIPATLESGKRTDITSQHLSPDQWNGRIFQTSNRNHPTYIFAHITLNKPKKDVGHGGLIYLAHEEAAAKTKYDNMNSLAILEPPVTLGDVFFGVPLFRSYGEYFFASPDENNKDGYHEIYLSPPSGTTPIEVTRTFNLFAEQGDSSLSQNPIITFTIQASLGCTPSGQLIWYATEKPQVLPKN